jgi:hypothetical protein
MRVPRVASFTLVLVLSIALFPIAREAQGQVSFRRGDSNGDGTLDISDAIHLLGFLFLGGPAVLSCEDAADANGDGTLDLSDAVYVLLFLFQGGAAPPAPGPDTCGTAPMPALGCESYGACEAPPTVTAGPTATPPTVDEGVSTSLSVSATDPEGDPLSFSWSQVSPASPSGTFSDAGAQNPTWTAPLVAADSDFALRVVVSDGRGGRAQKDLVLTVKNVNHPPSISLGPTATPSPTISGERVKLSVIATDPDADKLVYSWRQTSPVSPLGAFSAGQGTAAPTWASPEVVADTVFMIEVSVTDGQSEPLKGTVSVTVKVPTLSKDVQTIFTGNCSCHSGSFPSAGMNLSVGHAFSNLVNVTASACNPEKRVLPAAPDQSVLVEKISGTQCGSRMPRNNPAFFDSNPNLVTRIRSWILNGAQDN